MGIQGLSKYPHFTMLTQRNIGLLSGFTLLFIGAEPCRYSLGNSSKKSTLMLSSVDFETTNDTPEVSHNRMQVSAACVVAGGNN